MRSGLVAVSTVVATTAVGSGGEVAVAVAHVGGLEAMEVVRRCMVAAVLREAAVIAVAGIEVAIHGAVEVVGAMEPGAGSDEDAAIEPLRAVVAVRRAVVGGVVIVAVGAFGRGADIDADGNLGVGFWCWEKGDGKCGRRCDEKSFYSTHGNLHGVRRRGSGQKLPEFLQKENPCAD